MYLGNEPSEKFLSTQKDRFTGLTGSSVTLSQSVSSVSDIIVWVNSVKQDYNNISVSGTTLTLSGNLISDDVVQVAYIGRTVGTISPATSSVTNEMLAGSIASSKLASGVIPTNTPAFWVIKNASQSISGDTSVKLTFETEIIDSAGAFSSSKFQPQTSGYYYIYAQARFNANDDADQWKMMFYKNGSELAIGSTVTRTQQTAQLTSLVQLNGSSDYLEFYVYHNLAGTTITVQNQSTYTFAQGFKIIGI